MDQENVYESVNANEGWADTMQKILKSKKPKRKKTIILAKAKKLSSINAKSIKSESNDENEVAKIKLRKVDWLSKGRLKPNPLDRNKEKQLQKVAVRGVIQLFNAVNQIQKKIVNPTTSTFKEEKQLKSINKNAFLDILLKGSNNSKSRTSEKEENKVQEEDETVKEEETDTWNVLKDNFMTSKKWKNWDKNEEETEVIDV